MKKSAKCLNCSPSKPVELYGVTQPRNLLKHGSLYILTTEGREAVNPLHKIFLRHSMQFIDSKTHKIMGDTQIQMNHTQGWVMCYKGRYNPFESVSK